MVKGTAISAQRSVTMADVGVGWSNS